MQVLKFASKTGKTVLSKLIARYMLWPFIAALNPFRSAQCVPDSYYTANSFTCTFHCLQIPTSAKNLTLQSKSYTCKFQDGRFTAQIHYLHTQLLANLYNPLRQTKNTTISSIIKLSEMWDKNLRDAAAAKTRPIVKCSVS